MIGSPVTTQASTVYGPNATSCGLVSGANFPTISYLYIDDVSVQSLDVVINSMNVCSNTPTLASISCITNAPFTAIWSPTTRLSSSTAINPTITLASSVTYSLNLTLTDASSVTCSAGTQTVFVNVVATPTISAVVNPYYVCLYANTTVTLTASGTALTYTLLPLNVSTATATDIPTTTTNYTLIGANSLGCKTQTTVLVTVDNLEPSFTYTVSNPFVCVSSTSSTISITTPASPYFTVTAVGGFSTSGNYSVVVNPSVTTVYTIAVTNAYGCVTTKTTQITMVSCACIGGPSAWDNLGIIPINAALTFTSDFAQGGAVTFSNNCIVMYPNVKITIYPSSTLTIIGSHLYACGDMWKGIIVKPGGVLNIQSTTANSSFIEDAYVAVDVEVNTSTTTVTNILSIKDAIFNRNQVGIRIADYAPNQTTYPFTIQNNLFTSRTVTFSAFSWPTVTTIKNGASGYSSALQTPYISSTYALTTLKSPLATSTPSTGIVLSNVGWTSSNGNTWKGIAIGNHTNTANFNCFDNLREDIYAFNSNFQVTNNVFQNGARYGRGSVSGGKGIVAISITINPDAIAAKNNQVLIQSVGSTTNLGNYFYEKTSAAEITGYINTVIENNAVYSYNNSYSTYTVANTYGNTGFSLKTNRYYNMTLQKNKLYNIKNAMLIGLDAGPYSVGTQQSYGRLVGNITVITNTVNRYPVTAVASEFVNIALSIADPFAAASTTIIGGGSSSNAIYSNRFTNVHNGISVANIGFSAVNITTNTIGMVNEPNTIVANPIQNGILVNQIARPLSINQNSITGATSYSAGVKGISTSLNGLLSVQCNTTASLARGIEFNQGQTVSAFEDNTMQNQTYGLVLDNNAVLTTSVLGSTTRPTNNVWLSSWTIPNYKTFTTGGSSAQNGKMYIQYGNTQLDPDASAFTTGNLATDRYKYIGVSAITLLNVTTPAAIGCRISSGGGGGSGGSMAAASAAATTFSANTTNAQQVMEQMATNGITYTNNVTETQVMNKILTYHSLKAEPSLKTGSSMLTNFYTNAQTTNLQKAVAIEDDLAANNYTTAQTKISSYSPVNSIESNYKLFYATYLKTKTNAYTPADSLNLITMANTCPYTNGGVVYQARALYNILYSGYYRFIDNCLTNASNSRLINNIDNADNINQQTVNVIFKSKLYPNPNMGEFSIELTNKVEQTKVQICIFDNNGKQFVKEEKQVINSVVNCNYNLINGTYLVKVILQDGSVDVHRLIISK